MYDIDKEIEALKSQLEMVIIIIIITSKENTNQEPISFKSTHLSNLFGGNLQTFNEEEFVEKILKTKLFMTSQELDAYNKIQESKTDELAANTIKPSNPLHN